MASFKQRYLVKTPRAYPMTRWVVGYYHEPLDLGLAIVEHATVEHGVLPLVHGHIGRHVHLQWPDLLCGIVTLNMRLVITREMIQHKHMSNCRTIVDFHVLTSI